MTEPEQPKKYRSSVYPVYNSMAAAAASIGVPMAMLKNAKAKGCPGFEDSRVRMEDFLRWHFDPANLKKAEGELLDLTQARARESDERAKKLARDNAIEDKEIVTMTEAKDLVLRGLMGVRQRLDGLPSEMAPKCNPENPAFALEQLQTWVDNQLPIIREAMANLKVEEKEIEG